MAKKHLLQPCAWIWCVPRPIPVPAMINLQEYCLLQGKLNFAGSHDSGTCIYSTTVPPIIDRGKKESVIELNKIPLINDARKAQ